MNELSGRNYDKSPTRRIEWAKGYQQGLDDFRQLIQAIYGE